MNKDIIMATWNVRTMLQVGKMKEIANEMLKYKIDIIALQEIRWQGQGIINKANYTLIYSGPETRTGQLTTGFIMTRKMREGLLETETVNDRICRIRLKGRFRNITILSVHAPTEEKDEEEKEMFYDQMDDICNKVQKYDMVIIMGDLNAKIGREKYLAKVAGKYTIHDESNDNGNRLAQFAIRNRLLIKSTTFPHKKIHLGTWKIPGSSEVNQIDHVLVSQRHSTSVIDVRSCRGPNCDSDHYLVKARIRERIIKTQKGQKMGKGRWDTDKLNKDTEVRQQYQKALASKMQINSQERTDDITIEKEWEKIKNAINEAAEETVGENKRIRNADWFDDECAQIIQEKNKARKRMIQKETRMNTERYQEMRRKANRVCKKKKREKMKKQLEDIAEYSKQNERRKFYKAVEKVKKGYQPRMEGCINKEGDIILEGNKVLERWVEHFKELLNAEDKERVTIEEKVRPDKEEDREEVNIVEKSHIEEPSRQEITRRIHKLKNNKAPGEDNVTAELVKYGGEVMIDAIHKLICTIWETEKMPEGWSMGILCPIYKKGNKLACENYRGITLLNVVYKILSSIINERLKVVTENVIGEYQCGFRPNRSTIDQLFVIRQMMEKCYEHNIELHILFVDFKQAFDSINRIKLLEAMEEMEIPHKLIRLIKMTLNKTMAKVKIHNQISKEFEFSTGVKQGDGLSTTLFILGLHRAIQKIDQRGTIFNKSSQICAYADDIALIARSRQRLVQVYKELEEEAGKIGLIVNINKTKYMAMNSSGKPKIIHNLQIGQVVFEGVDEFKYLGNIIDCENRSTACINERIQVGNRAYYANLRMLKSKLINRNTKIQIYKSLIRPVITYGAETWTLTIARENALRRFERRVLRRICGPVIENGVWRMRSNEELNTIMKGEDIVKFIKSLRIQWLGHVERMEDVAMPRRVLGGRLYATRRRGRPRLRWLDDVTEDLGRMRVRNWREQAGDRERWRLIVEEAKAHPGL